MGSLNRREFIKAATVGGAGMALAPNMVSANSKVRFQRSKPNGKLNIAFIGVGGRGRGHLNDVSKYDDVEITAICDVDPVAITKARKILNDHSRKGGYKKRLGRALGLRPLRCMGRKRRDQKNRYKAERKVFPNHSVVVKFILVICRAAP